MHFCDFKLIEATKVPKSEGTKTQLCFSDKDIADGSKLGMCLPSGI